MERVSLLISDLDGTLLGSERALDAFVAWYAKTRERLRLVYSSGRFLKSIEESIRVCGLPAPDAIICGVGTEIYEDSSNKRVLGWPPLTYHWNPHIVRDACATHQELQEQPCDLLSYHKVSYYGYDLDDSFLRRLMLQLNRCGQDVTMVYSSNRDLDILPSHTDKGCAASFLARRWRIPESRVIVAGDSGNDLGMFRAGFRGIVVGNAQSELQRLKSPNVYHARAEYAAGVLEGLKHWLEKSWFEPSRDPITAGRSTQDRHANRDRHE